MLADGSEFPCETIDVSPIGIAIRGLKIGKFGERVVAYIQGLGRVEGFIARRATGWFALDIRAPRNKIERFDERIAWLVNRATSAFSESRTAERIEVSNEFATLRGEDGREYAAELMDVSIDGAAVHTHAQLAVGDHVMLGEQPARVVRVFEGGLAVQFDHAR